MFTAIRKWEGLFVLFALALVIALLSIDDRSLWTDEIGTWQLTLPNTFSAWSSGFWSHYNSDGQIPLYHAFMWGWVQLFGSDEWVLRAANIPWLILALAGCARMSESRDERSWLFLSFSLSAFIWYYTNDARPYILFVAGACWILAGVIALSKPGGDEKVTADKGLCWLLLGAVVLIGGSVLGAFWLAGLAFALAFFWPAALVRAWGAARREWLPVLLAVLVIGVLLWIAIHSHLAGARASQAADFSLAGMAYGMIELLGAAGLGPSRNDLRTQVRSIQPLQLLAMVALAMLSAWTCLTAWWEMKSGRARAAVLTAVIVPLLLMVALGLLLHWRVVGRHLSALFPLLILAQARFLQRSFSPEATSIGRTAGLLLIAGLLASSLSIRWVPRHDKDDYRMAASWARAALEKGKSVVWVADERGLSYYGLALAGKNFLNTLPIGLVPFSEFKMSNDSADWPEVIIFSPREGVDRKHKVRPLLSTGHYRLVKRATAFEYYFLETRPAERSGIDHTPEKASSQ